ncbi:WD40-repeat-containing domain protein [Lenzites betulinus]|nr:WD40-repeat-containing domain protein [Lenzites betulinus]
MSAGMQAGNGAWMPPVYDMTRTPEEIHSYQLLGETGVGDPSVFARLAKWCPDGSAALAQCEDRTFRFLQLPAELLGITVESTLSASLPRCLPQSAPILDYAWYPAASIRNPASFCLVASIRECPVKLLDASDGRLRASYKIVDHRERHVAPHSLAFNPSVNRLYCGFEDAIEVFDVNRPGEGTRLHTTPSKKSRDGLKGIISALAFAPDMSSGLYAAGTLSPSSPTSSNIALFSEDTGEAPVMFLGADDRRGGAGYGVRASVSQLMFNPARPHLLYASFRRMDSIYCWDIRADVSRPLEVFTTAPTSTSGEERTRRPATNQRMRFDIDYGGRWLSVGDQDGGISVFDLAAQSDPGQGENAPQAQAAPRAPRATPIMQFDGHRDAVGSVGFHPLRALLLSVSGSRHFEKAASVAGERSGSDDEVEESGIAGASSAEPDQSPAPAVAVAVTISRERAQPVAHDTSAKLWCFERGAERAGAGRLQVPG